MRSAILQAAAARLETGVSSSSAEISSITLEDLRICCCRADTTLATSLDVSSSVPTRSLESSLWGAASVFLGSKAGLPKTVGKHARSGNRKPKANDNVDMLFGYHCKGNCIDAKTTNTYQLHFAQVTDKRDAVISKDRRVFGKGRASHVRSYCSAEAEGVGYEVDAESSDPIQIR